MANYRGYGYQYETSPRKLKPEYEPNKNPYKKKKSTLFESIGSFFSSSKPAFGAFSAKNVTKM